MTRTKQSPAKIDLDRWMKQDPSVNSEGGKMPDDSKLISIKILPEVYQKLKGLSKSQRMYQMAIVNAALITYLDEKEQELGLDLAEYSEGAPSSRVTTDEVKNALLNKSK